VGAGPAGLSAARRLQELGEEDFLVLEKSDRPGGLAASFRDNSGFTWDLGGHVIFSHYAAYDRLLENLIPAEEWVPHRQAAWVRFTDFLVPYPFQLHVNWLPEEKRRECLEGLKELGDGPPPPVDNFRDWILTRFGEGIARQFLLPYNRNLWGCDPGELGVYWLGDRVALPSGEMLADGARKSWGPNSEFRFPARGGTGEIWRRLASGLGEGRVRYEAEVTTLDLEARRVTTASGESFRYGRILSTMPLDLLGKMAGLDSGKGLRAAAIAVAGFGLEGARPDFLGDFTWMYFPEERTRLYRVTNFGSYSPANLPDPERNWSLLAEAGRPGAPGDLFNLIRELEADLHHYGLIPPGARVVSRWGRHIPYGYPLPTRDRENSRVPLLERLEFAGVFSRGRFGAWMYEVGNMDHSSRQGIEWAERLAGGSREITIANPTLVNSGRFKR